MGIANNVREVRMRTGMSIQNLAEAVGADDSTIRHIEGESADNVSFSLIQRLTSALKCNSVRDLFPGTMCPEIAQTDMRAHKRVHRDRDHTREDSPRARVRRGPVHIESPVRLAESASDYPLQVGDYVRVKDRTILERLYVGEVLDVTSSLFLVQHPSGFRECFRWHDLDGCKVRKYVEGWEEGQL